VDSQLKIVRSEVVGAPTLICLSGQSPVYSRLASSHAIDTLRSHGALSVVNGTFATILVSYQRVGNVIRHFPGLLAHGLKV
jgi:hypothetical protein